ncbi:Beta-1,4-galactosyltransferase 3 [Seminavis robusta]|uniref:Beta-1,4-galactosyltransferase 3 n=1 Tax=Seminavis robusta TaxID=568900 RepID=A0A9N8ELP6_9STRA|nr:Beta-1,4-galactosyltransferase 3 [Seminavis robusta]|eukprot:Sro1176_g249260.1 Beta-1,4-galactosyltransferase 3 (1098) ;mRNA; r:11703-15178
MSMFSVSSSRSHVTNGHNKGSNGVAANSSNKTTTTRRNRTKTSTSCWARFIFSGILCIVFFMFHKTRLFEQSTSTPEEEVIQPTKRDTTTDRTIDTSTITASNSLIPTSNNATTNNPHVFRHYHQSATVSRSVSASLPPKYSSAASAATETAYPNPPQQSFAVTKVVTTQAPPVTKIATTPPITSNPQKHAILIPYRDRAFHLEKFLEYMRPYLQRHFPDDTFTVYVIEQNDTSLFNRGWLTNVGLQEIKQRAPDTTCVTLHDVDLIPNGTSHVPYTSCRKPIHLASHMENFKWAIPYVQYCGGITGLSLQHWEQINGMSNDYLGWGGEDDDLWHRIRLNGLLMSPQPDRKSFPRPYRPSGPGEGYFRTISQSQEHHTQEKEHTNKKKTQKMLEDMWRGSTRWQTEGWNDVYYTVNGVNVTELSTEPLDMPEWQHRPLWIPPPKNKTASNSTAVNVTTTPTAPTTAPTTPPPTKPPTDPPTMQPTRDLYKEPKGPGIDKVVIIQAASKRSRNQLPTNNKLATAEPAPVLELVDIAYTGCDLLTRAAARSNVVWGACHYYDNNQKEDPYECSKAVHSGDFNFGHVLEGSYHQAQFPWHLPWNPWDTDPLEGTVRFSVVTHPYTRALDFFRVWYDTMNKNSSATTHRDEYIRQRESPEEINFFLKAYLAQDKGPWEAQPWMKGVFDMMPMYDFFANKDKPHYVKHILKYEQLESDWQQLAEEYNYTDTGIGEQLKVILEEKRAQEAQAKDWLTPGELDPETLELINSIFNNDFKFYKDYNKTTSGVTNRRTYKHPRTKNHKNTIAKGPLELVAIPYAGAASSLTRMAARAGIVWGACHFDQFQEWECPAKSGDFRDSQKVQMNGMLQFESPWYVPLKLWPKSPYGDLSKPDPAKAKTFTVVRNPYDRAIAFYRHMFDRKHGYPRGHHPRQDEDILFDMGSVAMDDYLRKREDPIRMNAFLQAHFTKGHNPHKPDGMELVPQSKYTTRVHHVIKYEALVDGCRKYLSKYNYGNMAGKKIDLEVFEQAAVKRANHTRAMNLGHAPRWLGKADLADETTAMINEIFMFDFYKWYRMEKRVKPNVDTSRYWRQPHPIPGQAKK